MALVVSAAVISTAFESPTVTTIPSGDATSASTPESVICTVPASASLITESTATARSPSTSAVVSSTATSDGDTASVLPFTSVTATETEILDWSARLDTSEEPSAPYACA